MALHYKCCWEPAADGGARLLRVYGEQAYVTLPQQVDGVTVTEIGDGCFASPARIPKSCRVTETTGDVPLHELSGSYLKTLALPAGVKKIGSLAFYNCTMLQSLELGREMEETGSDAFMNCRNLHQVTLHGGARERSGIRLILNQISSDMQVTFAGKETEAVLLFPEYYESYDEIAPAHLFGRSIEGEGFRARQCFKDGIVDFRQYDTIFPKACAEETVRTLCRLAMNRLLYPVDLQEEAKKLYLDYIKQHTLDVCSEAVEHRKLEEIRFLMEQNLLDRTVAEETIRLASQVKWVEGTAALLTLKAGAFRQPAASEEYSFDDL